MGAQHIVLAHGKRLGGEAEPWLLLGDRAMPLRHWADTLPLGRADSVTALVEAWSQHEADLRALTTSPDVAELIRARGAALRSLTLEAPIRPRQVFCTIGNYRSQVAQAAEDADDGPTGSGAAGRRRAAVETMRRRRRSGQPYVCLTSPGRVAGP